MPCNNGAPQGFEYTGEFRLPKKDEWYHYNNEAAKAYDDHTSSGRCYPILRHLPTIDDNLKMTTYGCVDPKIPDGYEATGEFRMPRNDEYFIPAKSYGKEICRFSGFYFKHFKAEDKRIILRKVSLPVYEIRVLESVPRQLKPGENGIDCKSMASDAYIFTGPTLAAFSPISITKVRE